MLCFRSEWIKIGFRSLAPRGHKLFRSVRFLWWVLLHKIDFLLSKQYMKKFNYYHNVMILHKIICPPDLYVQRYKALERMILCLCVLWTRDQLSVATQYNVGIKLTSFKMHLIRMIRIIHQNLHQGLPNISKIPYFDRVYIFDLIIREFFLDICWILNLVHKFPLLLITNLFIFVKYCFRSIKSCSILKQSKCISRTY